MGRKRGAKRQRIECQWANSPGKLRVTIRRTEAGRISKREVDSHGLLDASEAAAILRVTTPTVYRAVRQGHLRAKRQDSRLLMTLEDVATYLEDRVDVADARRALAEMRRLGLQPIPYERVLRRRGSA